MGRWFVPVAAAGLLAWTGLAGHDKALFISVNSLAASLPDAGWSCLTVLGDTLVALVLLLPLLWYRPAWVIAALFAAVPAGAITHYLKHWAHAPRPALVLGDAVHVIGPALHQGSFPSGHTTTAFVLAAVVMSGLRFSAPSLLVAAVALLVGLSRVCVGAHWPIDVAAGMAIGWMSGLAGMQLTQWRRFAMRPRPIAAVHALLLGCAAWLLFGHDSRYPLARVFEQTVALGALALYLRPAWQYRVTVAGVASTIRAALGSRAVRVPAAAVPPCSER